MITITSTTDKPRFQIANDFLHLVKEQKTITVKNNFGADTFLKVGDNLVKQKHEKEENCR